MTNTNTPSPEAVQALAERLEVDRSDYRAVAFEPDLRSAAEALRQFAARLACWQSLRDFVMALEEKAANEESSWDACGEGEAREAALKHWLTRRQTLVDVLAQMTAFDASPPAARLAQEAGTCETCQFARKPYFGPYTRTCALVTDIPGGELRFERPVPLTINGRPFRCDGYKAKPAPPDGDRALKGSSDE